MGHGGAFAGGTQNQNGIGLVFDVPLGDLTQFIEIHGAVGVERGDKSYDRALQIADVHHVFLLKMF